MTIELEKVKISDNTYALKLPTGFIVGFVKNDKITFVGSKVKYIGRSHTITPNVSIRNGEMGKILKIDYDYQLTIQFFDVISGILIDEVEEVN